MAASPSRPMVVSSSPKDHWLADSAVRDCMGCSKRFDTIRRKHHCRVCGGIFCEQCSGHKVTFQPYALDNSKSCLKCWQLFSAHLPCLFRKTAFLLRPSRGGAPRRILISLDEVMESFVLEEASNPAKSAARDDKRGLLGFNFEQYAVEDLSSVVDGQTSVSWRRTVRESESGGCCSFGPSDDLRVYAPMSFSLVFAAEVFDLQADTAAAKGEWMESCQSFLDHLQSPSGKAFRGLLNEARRRSQALQAKQAQVVDHVARSRSTQDNIRKKYQLPASGPTRRPPGVEELILD